jgi:hypothetical protein
MWRKMWLSFSMNRARGISWAKASLSRKIWIPLTKWWRQRKVGNMVWCKAVVIWFIIIWSLSFFLI